MRTTIDDLATRIEQAVTKLRGDNPAAAKKRMSLDEFVSHTLTQIGKAADDAPDLAMRRLQAVKRSVDDVIAGIAKMAAEDTGGDSVDIEIVTAFAPAGGSPVDGLTTASDQSSTEVSVSGVDAAAGDSNFAENLREVAKALATMKAELEASLPTRARAPTHKAAHAAPAAPGARADASTRIAGAARADGDHGEDADGWPLDLNNAAFLQGERPAEDALTWGADPPGVADTAASKVR